MLKKLLAGSVSLILASALCAICASAETYKKGDVNGSGVVDIEDAVSVIGYVNGSNTLDKAALRAGDIDRNGVIDIEDAVNVIGSINGVKPLKEDASELDSGSAEVFTSKINAVETGVTYYDVEADFNSAWDYLENNTDGEFGMYMGPDADSIMLQAWAMGSDSFKSKNIKDIAYDHRDKMILDGCTLVSEKETTFNSLPAYEFKYKFDFEDEEYTFKFIFAKSDEKVLLVSVDYLSKDEKAVDKITAPVLSSIKVSDNKAVDDILINRLNPFEDVINWGDSGDDHDDEGYERFYSFKTPDDWNVIQNFDNTYIFKCFDEHKEPACLNLYLSGRTSSEFKDMSVKEIAEKYFPELNVGLDADMKITKEEETKFNGYDAYHYDIDYLFDDSGFNEDGIPYMHSYDDWKVDVYFVKQDDKVLVVLSTKDKEFEDYLKFSNEKLDPIIETIKLEPSVIHEAWND